MEVLDFEKLVADYYENLVTTLRRFRPGPEYLETWVHDEDFNLSLVGIFESANDAKLDCLQVNLTAETAAGLDSAWLEQELSKLGKLTLSLSAEVPFLQLRYVASPKLGDCYQARIQERLRHLQYEGQTVGATATATFDGTRLDILLNEEGLVIAASHFGAKGDLRALMDASCEILVGRPLREGADHGVIRLEKMLREPGSAPVPGLITPDNADPLFAIPQNLIRGAMAQMAKPSGDNEWVDPLGPNWLSLSTEEQIVLAQTTLEAILSDLSLPYPELHVSTIQRHSRVVLDGHRYASDKAFGHELMKLEAELKRRIDPGLEITLETVEDRNKREVRTQRAPIKTLSDVPLQS